MLPVDLKKSRSQPQRLAGFFASGSGRNTPRAPVDKPADNPVKKPGD